MLIGMVTPYFHPAWQYGGTPRAAFELARALAARGHHVRVLTTDSAGDSRFSRDEIHTKNTHGIEVRYYRNISNYLARRHRLFLPAQFQREVRKELADCDVLHIHEFRSTLTVPAARTARELSIPYVLSPHGGLRHLGKHAAKTIFDVLWGRAILDGAAAVLVLTGKEERDALAFNIPPSRIRHLPNVIEPSDYSALPPRGLFRKKWNLPGGKIILFLGRLHAIKGPDLLVEAFASLRGELPDAVLVLAGPDDGQRANLQRMVERAGLTSSVVMTGFLGHEAKLEALVDSGVVVLPSRSEGSPLAVAEALLCNRPAVVSSAVEILSGVPSDFGILQFQSLDVRDLRDKLLFALGNDVLSNNARVGRQFVLREFSPAVVAEKAESIYKEAIFRGSAAPRM